MTSEKGTIWYNVDLSRGYKQGDDWKETTSLNQDDLLPMAKLLDEADTWIATRSRPTPRPAISKPRPSPPDATGAALRRPTAARSTRFVRCCCSHPAAVHRSYGS